LIPCNFNQRCEICNSYITYDISVRDENGEYILLDLNGKRHFCLSADKIVHECRAVDRVKKIIDDTNSTDLSSFVLELRIVDWVENNAS
jgi:hypothetical protein